MGVTVNFLHVADPGRDSVDLRGRLIKTFETSPNYFCSKPATRLRFLSDGKVTCIGKSAILDVRIVTLKQLHQSSRREIRRQNASFLATINNRTEPEALGLLKRQRVKMWLKKTYDTFDTLPV